MLERRMPAANLLIYEDDSACGHAFAMILRHAGYRVTLANHFTPALAALDGKPPVDLLIADIVMPPGGLNGVALARMARMKKPDIGIVYVSGYDVPGFDDDGLLLRKPIEDDQLLTAV